MIDPESSSREDGPNGSPDSGEGADRCPKCHRPTEFHLTTGHLTAAVVVASLTTIFGLIAGLYLTCLGAF